MTPSNSRFPKAQSGAWRAVLRCITLAASFAAVSASAASFEIAASPSRFELSGKSNSLIGQTLEIHNVGNSATEVSVRTLDWTYSVDGAVGFVDELLPGSCRPWVTIERRIVRIGPRSKAAFRFQVQVPPDAARGECRFMLAIEGVEPAFKALVEGGNASLSLPVTGRLAIAVYVGVNGAEPKLELGQLAVQTVKGKRTPILTVSNKGDAHGRLEGSLQAVDSKGQQFELVPDGSPIMPGQTRDLLLVTKSEANKADVEASYPVKSSGTLDWELGSFKISAEFK